MSRHFNLGGVGAGRGRPLPPDPCLSCYRGDSHCVVVAEGDEDWIAGCLVTMANFPVDEAVAWVERYWDGLIAAPETRPGHRLSPMVLCRACAERAHERTGVKIYRRAEIKDADAIFALCQPPEEDTDGTGT